MTDFSTIDRFLQNNRQSHLPLQVKFLIEGQEKNASEVLQAKLSEIADQIACEVIVISDSSQYANTARMKSFV